MASVETHVLKARYVPAASVCSHARTALKTAEETVSTFRLTEPIAAIAKTAVNQEKYVLRGCVN